MAEQIGTLNDDIASGETPKTIKINALSFQQWDSTLDLSSFTDSTATDKKFKIQFITKAESSVTPDVKNTTNESDSTKIDKTVTVDGNTNPASQYNEPDISGATGDATINYKNVDDATIVLNKENNKANGENNGPIYNLENSTIILDLTNGDINISELNLVNCKVIVKGYGHTFTAHVNMDALSSIKFVDTKFNERKVSSGE